MCIYITLQLLLKNQAMHILRYISVSLPVVAHKQWSFALLELLEIMYSGVWPVSAYQISVTVLDILGIVLSINIWDFFTRSDLNERIMRRR